MDRRDVIKNLALALGCTIATPTLLSILSSCSQNEKSWKPLFFNERQKYIIDYLVEIILPKTNTPGGQELNVAEFIDKMIDKTVVVEEQNLFNLGSEKFIEKYESLFQKNILKGEKSEFKTLLKPYFDKSKDEEKAIFKLVELSFIEVDENERENFLMYKFLIAVRYYSLLGYYTSQTIMEEILDYNPIPGFYNGCVDL